MSQVKLNFQTFILAGGLGNRLRMVVSDRPKPMADVLGVPFLEILTRLLEGKGVRKFVMLVGYKAHARDGWSREERPEIRY